jgi:hypothetical protein
MNESNQPKTDIHGRRRVPHGGVTKPAEKPAEQEQVAEQKPASKKE